MEHQKRFQDRVIIITGAASGIGLATAQRIGSEGGTIVIADLDREKIDRATDRVLQFGAATAWGTVCDVSDPVQVKATVDETVKRFGHLDVVVNNAGIMIYKPLEEHTTTDWIKVLSVDLLGAFSFTREAFLHMKNGGAIVNVSSIHAIETTPLVASYAAAKAALLSLTRSSAIEGKAKGIRVNAVLPGAIETPMLRNNPNIKTGLEVINQTDVGAPEDIASTIAFLASDDACFIQGTTLRIDGGRLARL